MVALARMTMTATGTVSGRSRSWWRNSMNYVYKGTKSTLNPLSTSSQLVRSVKTVCRFSWVVRWHVSSSPYDIHVICQNCVSICLKRWKPFERLPSTVKRDLEIDLLRSKRDLPEAMNAPCPKDAKGASKTVCPFASLFAWRFLSRGIS